MEKKVLASPDSGFELTDVVDPSHLEALNDTFTEDIG